MSKILKLNNNTNFKQMSEEELGFIPKDAVKINYRLVSQTLEN
ncbi:hypothetical protein ACFQ0R_01400 [Psychroflexus salinarum]|uniref:Uncharacterized protein n=1 Tax=Psychroflexus salinarum TaxID=546024 RepID=A0ABW3GNF2_9FLAO